MGIKHLWDTNIAIYYLQQQFSISAEKFIDNILQNSKVAISVITEVELLCWRAATTKDLEILHSFITDSFVFKLNKDIKFKTAQLRKKYKIKLPDAIIAATVLVYDLVLVTRNATDFKSIVELQIVNPWDK